MTRGLAAPKPPGGTGGSGEQSSVGAARVRADRWERRLPLSARSVSHPTTWLMTADRSSGT
jgi:hypothetical protein